jgi:hypothetical protein
MSNVTDVFVIIGDTEGANAETIAPKVAEAICAFICDEPGSLPVISVRRDDWQSLQSGKVAGGAAIWFGWNYGYPDELEEHLKAAGFTHITVWSHHEFGGRDGIPPRVVSW